MRIALAYAIVGAVWILLSDWLLDVRSASKLTLATNGRAGRGFEARQRGLARMMH